MDKKYWKKFYAQKELLIFMALYKKISIAIKKKSPKLWLYIKSIISFIRHIINTCDFPVLYYTPIDVVYLQVPKTATSTTLSLFLNKLGIEFDDKNYHSIHESTSPFLINEKELRKVRKNKEVFTFTFVRNPYTRLISCYKDKIKTEKDTDILNDYFGVFNTDMSFEEFVLSVCKIPNFWANTHFKSQTSFVFFKGMTDPDFIGKFENYANDVAFLQRKLNLPKVEQSFNVTGSTYDLSDWYTKELAEKVYKRFKNDFDLFGYDKNLNNLP